MLFLQGSSPRGIFSDSSLNYRDRILAHAGFDARSAVEFWETRPENECARLGNSKSDEDTGHLQRNLSSPRHPMSESRTKILRDELQRWETERKKAVAKRTSVSPPS